MNGNLNSNRARRHSLKGTELGAGRRREKKSLDTRRDKYMYTSRQVTIIYGNKIKPQGRPREKLGIEETARQGVQNDRLPRLGSFRVSPPRSVFENEARYVILFITAKCKPVTAERGAERNINTNGQICLAGFCLSWECTRDWKIARATTSEQKRLTSGNKMESIRYASKQVNKPPTRTHHVRFTGWKRFFPRAVLQTTRNLTPPRPGTVFFPSLSSIFVGWRFFFPPTLSFDELWANDKQRATWPLANVSCTSTD